MYILSNFMIMKVSHTDVHCEFDFSMKLTSYMVKAWFISHFQTCFTLKILSYEALVKSGYVENYFLSI